MKKFIQRKLYCSGIIVGVGAMLLSGWNCLTPLSSNLYADEDKCIGYEVASANATGYIGIERAKSIALEHAGLNENQVDFIKTEFDFDDGLATYEIEFIANMTKYEYDINASNGTIIKYEMEKVNR